MCAAWYCPAQCCRTSRRYRVLCYGHGTLGGGAGAERGVAGGGVRLRGRGAPHAGGTIPAILLPVPYAISGTCTGAVPSCYAFPMLCPLWARASLYILPHIPFAISCTVLRRRDMVPCHCCAMSSTVIGHRAIA
eukprot:878291-Rhodomonas_salina.1